MPLAALVVMALVFLLAGCAAARAAHPVWSGPLCGVEMRPVVTEHDAELRRVFGAVAVVARPDLPSLRGHPDIPTIKLEAVAVERTWRERAHVGGMCRRGSVALIVVSADALPGMVRDGAARLAITLGHELAHLTLRHQATPWRDAAKELEADELGVYYARRAGFACRPFVTWAVDSEAVTEWPEPAKYRAAVAAACAGAERGVRPEPRFSR